MPDQNEALNAVLALHAPVTDPDWPGHGPWCAECSRCEDEWTHRCGHALYPCPTRRAITGDDDGR